jgi:acetyltransferase-like isoleucine patch superfamily enzyme
MATVDRGLGPGEEQGRGDLAHQLRELHLSLQMSMKERWNRSLPFEDELFDRWERAQFLGFGNQSSIYQQSYVYGDVRVGAHTWVGPMTLLDGTGGLTIGDYCSISAGVQIYTHDTVKWALTAGKAVHAHGPVVIGNCCHIGALSIVVKGVTIGDHCVVGAHSFVNRDVPAYTVVAGVPARPIGTVEMIGEDEVRIVFPASPEVSTE